MSKIKLPFVIISALLTVIMLSSTLPWLMGDAEYWPAQKAYNDAVASGDAAAILDAVKLIEAAYPEPSSEAEYLRLYYPSLKAAGIYESEGRYDKAAEYYGRCYTYAKALDGGSGAYRDIVNASEMLYRHNNITPTLYVESADVSKVPFYGARAENEAGCLQGMTDYFDKEHDNAQILYVQFFNEDIEPFSWQLPVDTEDYTLMVAWNVPNENAEDLIRISEGEADDYIRRNLEYLSTLKCRVLIRFGAEVNCWLALPANKADAEADGGAFAEIFKTAFRYVSSKAKEYCPSAGMIYSPNDVSNWFYHHTDFYPGDEYVDWVGMSSYNNLPSKSSFEVSDSSDAFYSIGDYYDNQIVKIESLLEAYGDRKPIIITEGGTAHESDNGLQTEEHALESMRFFYTYINRVYPQVKCVMYFNSNYSSNKYSIFGLPESNSAVAELYRALNSQNVTMQYLMGKSDKCAYVPFDGFTENIGELSLSLYAAYPTSEEVRVEYYLDGVEVLNSTEYPYSYDIDVNDLAVGGHLFRVHVTCRNTETWMNYKVTVTEDGTVSVSDPIPSSITDVSQKFWGYDAVMYGMARDLFNGTSDSTFDPNGSVTRAMFVTILARMSGVDPADYKESSFVDVKAGKWFSPYVEWAKSKGIVNGKTETTFAPDDKITREQMCTILVRYCEIFGIELDSSDVPEEETEYFADHDDISSYALEYVYTAKFAGLVSGKSGNVFDPKAGATRAESATIFMRFMISFMR